MKKIIFIFIISFIAFSFLSCEKNEEIRKDTSVQIKKIIRSTKPNDVKEYEYKNQNIYRFIYNSDGSISVLYDKKGNYISQYGYRGVTGAYYNDRVCPDFEEKAVFIRNIYPINN